MVASAARITAKTGDASVDVCFGLATYQASSGVCAYAVESRSLAVAPAPQHPGDLVEVTFTIDAHLVRGHYLLELQASNGPTGTVLARSHPAAFLQVDETASTSGVADLGAACRVRRLEAQDFELLTSKQGSYVH